MSVAELRFRPIALLVTSLVFATAIAGCDDDDNTTEPPVATTGTVVVQLDHFVDVAAAEMDVMTYTNAAGNDYSVRTLLYIVSDVTVSASTSRTDFGDNMAHYRDAREASTRTATLERVPPGTYDFLSFTFGMDEEDNRDPSQGGEWPQTPEWEAMRWPSTWGGGYHYMKLEGDFVTSGGPTELSPSRPRTSARFA